ncbi:MULTISPECIES: 3-phosphoserine/phosphohydroxythreonine transaminase [unclassified Burkholderia]|uniref:3-phosphoserine/phosphohydroxythreonine transaminase n=1 Tax=unclassified Burkholderia TaxID=2613784 RepID=UPI000F57F5B1|nr:3-phosphoserine/phosphohydroxythreonine transaminase [Burkholderia sp. Bp9012]RQR77839.1 3-phosphoserine/phosphohydroxythreonine transaminase [Burkholderia sp. Bp9011]RQR87835.1 3-phosphoserine/phosphohydroxythreonine transaminase [Burkholderia sp. Bp9010]RQZ43775.1 3-phosphoserine/phosphohydroxythreonine transaminase [Burkholderia sp. Bp9099]
MNLQYNFSGGPGALPLPVLMQAQDAIREIPGVGLSVLGITHRSPWFRDVVDECEANIRHLLKVPDDYHVLFLQGGSTLQFAMLAMNFSEIGSRPPAYVSSGYWSRKSVLDSGIASRMSVAWDGEPGGFRRIPQAHELEIAPGAAYLHYVSNETVEGLQIFDHLSRGDTPIFCDMSSDFMSRPVDVARYAMIYAHAQKNLGPAGITIVILRNDLVERAQAGLASILDYRTHIDARSIYNTPPVFSIYIVLLVTRWIRESFGDLTQLDAYNRQKANLLYQVLDASPGFYVAHAEPDSRSRMNVTFNCSTQQTTAQFLQEARTSGFHGLDGHRSIGGVRASLYNAVTEQETSALARFMTSFRDRHA